MKCWICEKETEATRRIKFDGKNGPAMFGDKVETKYRAYCPECQKKHDEEVKQDKANYVILKKKMMFERAMELMEKQGCNMSEYRNAAVRVQRYLYANLDKFDSADELIAAIVLIKNGLQIKMQHKIGRYQVDIIIPEIKIALEIDGERHKQKKDYDSWRDIEIKQALGEEWEVVRISTDHLEKNCGKLLQAIGALKNYKQALK